MKIFKEKILYLIFISTILFGFAPCASSATVEVRSLSDFSTANPPSTISIQILEPVQYAKNKYALSGTKITGKIVDVKSPKRLKRDASFSFKPISYTDSEGVSHTIKTTVKAKYTRPIDKEQIAGTAVKSAGNFFIKGFSMGVSAVEGAVKNEQNNRLKSSAVSLYESSPISYIEKGEDITIKKSDTFYLKFPDYEEIENTTTKE